MGADEGYAALYPRVSTTGQKDNWSVKDQLGLGRLVAPRGWKVVLYDGDLGISAETIEARRDMTALLRDLELGRISKPRDMDGAPVPAGATLRGIIVCDWNRLSRDQDLVDSLRIKKVCRDAGCLIITPGKVYDFESDADEMLSVFEAIFASNQNKARAKATTRAQYTKAQDGRWPGGPIQYGYRVVNDVPHRDGRFRGRLEVDPVEAEGVRRCYALYADGYTDPQGLWRPLSFEAVARQLTAEGYRFRRRQTRDERLAGTPPVYTAWGCMDVQRVVAGKQRRRYLGYELWGQGGVSRHAKDIGAVEKAKPELRIVDTALFLRAEAQRAKRRKEPARLGCPTYALQGLLRCPHCEGRTVANRQMVRYKGVEKGTAVDYACITFRHFGASPDGGCPDGGYYVAEKTAVRAVTAYLAERFQWRHVDAAIDLEVARQKAEHDQGQIKSLRQGLDEVALKEKRLKDAYVEGVYSLAELREQKDGLDAERERLQRRLAGLTTKARATDEMTEAVEAVRKLGSVPRTLAWLAEAQPARYRAFVALFFDGLTVVAEGPKRAKGGRTARVVKPQWTAAAKEWLGLPEGQEGDAPDSTSTSYGFRELAKVEPLPAPFLQALASLAPDADGPAIHQTATES